MRRYRFLIIALCIALCIPSFVFADENINAFDNTTRFTINGWDWGFRDNVFKQYTWANQTLTVPDNPDWQYDPQGYLYITSDNIHVGDTISVLIFGRKGLNLTPHISSSNLTAKYIYQFDDSDDWDNVTQSDLSSTTTVNIVFGADASTNHVYKQYTVKNAGFSYTGGFYLTGFDLGTTYDLSGIYVWKGGISDKPKESILNTSVGSGFGASTSVIAVLPGFGCVIENGTNTQFELTFDGSTKKYNGGSFYSGQRVWASNAWLNDFQLNRFAETEENIKWDSDGTLLHRSASGTALISVPSGKYTYFVNPAQYIEYGQSVYNNGNMFIRPLGGNAKLVKTFRLGNPSNTDNAEDNAFEITMHDDTQFYEIGSYNGQDSQYYPSNNSQYTAYDSSYSGTPEGYNQYQLPSGGGISADEIGSFNDNTSAINQFLSDATQNASSIQQNASGFFQTLRTMFSWLPDEIISLLIAFISIVLIVGLFKVFL